MAKVNYINETCLTILKDGIYHAYNINDLATTSKYWTKNLTGNKKIYGRIDQEDDNHLMFGFNMNYDSKNLKFSLTTIGLNGTPV